jgi:hypothetical protein
MPKKDSRFNGIGTLQENSLHADLKRWYALPEDQLEVQRSGYVIDICRGDLLVEIQTRNFSAIRRKLERLCEQNPVRLVHPIAQERWIVKQPVLEQGKVVRRKSPRRGTIEHIFIELVRLPHLILNPNFSVDVLLTREEEIRVDDGLGSWRRQGWSIQDRRLLEVTGQTLLSSRADYQALLPASLPAVFTTRDLAAALGQPLNLAQKMAYCFRKIGLLRLLGKRGRSLLYEKDEP